MNKALSFNDIILVPQFSTVKSRADVDPTIEFLGKKRLPIISSNMDTVTMSPMCHAMSECNALGALHRFMSIEDNVKEYLASPPDTIVSFGIGRQEKERFGALLDAGAKHLMLDVAHAANINVVEFVKDLNTTFDLCSNRKLIVGNFATASEILAFKHHLDIDGLVYAWKVGVGSGSFCSTREVTGCGLPTIEALRSMHLVDELVIADGGISSSGDLAKAIAFGATAVMIGRLFAGTDEAPGLPFRSNSVYRDQDPFVYFQVKEYRGSASKESYMLQNKESKWRTPEGETGLVLYTGSVKDVVQHLDAGLRSAMSYTGAHTLYDFQTDTEFLEVTTNGYIEGTPHGFNKFK